AIHRHVEDDVTRSAQHGGREPQALLHPERVAADLAMSCLGHRDGLEYPPGAAGGEGGRSRDGRRARRSAPPGGGPGGVEDGSDALGRPRLGGQREPVAEAGSGGGLVEPEEASPGRGLAGSVPAEDPGDGSGGDREAQSFNSGHLAVALRETVDLDHARPPWDRLAESGSQSRPPVRRRSSTGDAAATTAATTRAPSARPASTSWT